MVRELDSETVTSTNAYSSTTDFVLKWVSYNLNELLFDIQEKGVNSVTIKVEGSFDEDFTNPREIKEETVLSDSGIYESLSNRFNFVRVRVKSTVADVHGSLQVNVSGG